VVGVQVLEARSLVRRLGPTRVLAGLDLKVAAGEIVGVFGPNGAGKTTLVRVLATLLRPTSGDVSLFGEDAFGPDASRVRCRLGLVTHESFLDPDLTGIENLLFYARLYGVRDGNARADELMAWAGLKEHGRRPVRAYSRGMVQRLALARALLHRPDLLFLDEPFSGLDARAAEAVEQVMEGLRSEGRAVLLTTHDIDRGLRITDRVYILNRGRVAWGSPGPVDSDEFKDAYRRAVGAR
jgi:heme exporter protein A